MGPTTPLAQPKCKKRHRPVRLEDIQLETLGCVLLRRCQIIATFWAEVVWTSRPLMSHAVLSKLGFLWLYKGGVSKAASDVGLGDVCIRGIARLFVHIMMYV